MTTDRTWSKEDGSHDPELSRLIRTFGTEEPSSHSTRLILECARAATGGWDVADGTHDPEVSALIQKNLCQQEPSQASTDRILAYARRGLAGSVKPLRASSEVDSAANDPVFAPAWLELRAAADGAERISTTIMHEVAGIAYGEIAIEQFGGEVDLVYQLLPEHLNTYANYRVSLTLAGKTIVLGPLDQQGKATVTIALSEIPIELECHFLAPQA